MWSVRLNINTLLQRFAFLHSVTPAPVRTVFISVWYQGEPYLISRVTSRIIDQYLPLFTLGFVINLC